MAPELVLQPGSVVNAQVLKVLSADLVRIAIASLSIDVASEIPLQQGQNLQLAVTQTKDGIRLAMVGQGGDAAGPTPSLCRPMRWPMRPSIGRPSCHPKNVLTPLERISRLRRRASRGHRTGQPGAVVCQSGCCGFLQQSAAETAGGDCAGAGATDQPRSKSRRRRHQDRVPEVRNFSRGVAGGRFSPRERRSRSQGRADRASPDAAVGAWQQRDSRDAGDTGRGSASRAVTGHRREPCAVFVSQSRCPGNPAAAGTVAGRRKSRAGRPGRPQSACGGARRRTFGRCDLEPVAGSVAGAWQPGARGRHVERRSRRRHDLSHQHAAAADPRRASGRAARSHSPPSRRMRRSRRPRIICSTIPMPPSRGKPCCRWRPCRTASTLRRRRPT